MRLLCSLVGLAALMSAGQLYADGPRDNLADNVRPIPPKGIAISDEDRDNLRKGSDEVGKEIDSLRKTLKPALRELLPDVEVLYKEVRLGKNAYDAAHHVPVLIYPNPLNPRRYVVFNSGFTFREYDSPPKGHGFAVMTGEPAGNTAAAPERKKG
jgi:hypothetical protein